MVKYTFEQCLSVILGFLFEHLAKVVWKHQKILGFYSQKHMACCSQISCHPVDQSWLFHHLLLNSSCSYMKRSLPLFNACHLIPHGNGSSRCVVMVWWALLNILDTYLVAEYNYQAGHSVMLSHKTRPGCSIVAPTLRATAFSFVHAVSFLVGIVATCVIVSVLMGTVEYIDAYLVIECNSWIAHSISLFNSFLDIWIIQEDSLGCAYD